MDFAMIQKTSLVDYPGEICSTVFTIGCNFRCPFCYNASLVLPEKRPDKTISGDEILDILEQRKGKIKALCITGGEPTLHSDLYDFIKNVKEHGILVKLDTNGTNPDLVRKLLDDNLVDYWAIDVKIDKDNYRKATGVDAPVDKVAESIKMVAGSGIAHDFRTTVVPGIHNDVAIEGIGKWLNELGEKERYVIQTFYKPQSAEFVDPELKVRLFTNSELEFLTSIAQKFFENVEVRNYLT